MQASYYHFKFDLLSFGTATSPTHNYQSHTGNSLGCKRVSSLMAQSIYLSYTPLRPSAFSPPLQIFVLAHYMIWQKHSFGYLPSSEKCIHNALWPTHTSIASSKFVQWPYGTPNSTAQMEALTNLCQNICDRLKMLAKDTSY